MIKIKKILTACLVIALIFSLAACGEASKEKESSKAISNTAKATADSTPEAEKETETPDNTEMPTSTENPTATAGQEDTDVDADGTTEPTDVSTLEPTTAPTKAPTAKPTVIPTVAPTITPSPTIEVPTIAPSPSAEPITNNFSKAKVGEYIFFGQYEQDNDTSNGKEDIEWLVLDKQDNKVLVVSKYALDCKLYHEEYESITWEDCTLRTWLNNDFINTAFSKDEKAMIPTVTVVNDDNDQYGGSEGGNDTQDKVFLLSIDEINKYFDSDEERMCGTTDYAKAQGANTYDGGMASGKATCRWWLRTPGYRQNRATGVFQRGVVDDYGYLVYVGGDGVRPALWINLES